MGREDEERHDDDPLAAPKRAPNAYRREADEDEAHRHSLRGCPPVGLLARARRAAAAAIVLDVDGTLAPIVARPESVGTGETRGLLTGLIERCRPWPASAGAPVRCSSRGRRGRCALCPASTASS